MNVLRPLAAAAGLLLVAACAVPRPPQSAPADLPARWHAPLPHDGTLHDLTRWWQQFDDPLLVDLVSSAQEVNPTVATAATRIAEARAARVTARAGLLPTVDASSALSRGNAQAGVPLSTILQSGVQAAWELDLFGGQQARLDAARARLDGAQAGWHEARIAVAAETAQGYIDLRICERQLAVLRQDARSRAETARLTGLSAEAGFTAPAVAAQARASAAEASARTTQQQGQCDLLIKALVAVTGMGEPRLRRRLAGGWDEPASFARIAVPEVPAALLAQRPDIHRAQRAVEAASGEVAAARADQLPRVSVSSQLLSGWIRAGGTSTAVQTWSLGPLAVSIPVFDAGRRAAGEDAAQARYEEALVVYRAQVRQAVREVEEALVALDSARARAEDARTAVEGYRASFVATEALYRSGLGSLIELEDQRRVSLAAETALVTLQRERIAAWIALYRALGGPWERSPRPGAAAREVVEEP